MIIRGSILGASALRRLSTQHVVKTNNDQSRPHTPVMLRETLEYLRPTRGEVYIDMTFGAGGHTRKILDSAENTTVFALDRDPVAHNFARELSQQYPNRLIPLLGRFSELPELLKQHNVKFKSVDGILFDFGCSSMQFDEGERGFSVSKNGYLDMRMDKNRFPDQPTCAEILAKIDEEDLARIIKMYGDEKNAKKIARAIIDTRYAVKKVETTKELADIVSACCYDEMRLDKLNRPTHTATKTFQALRIFINNELNEINYGMLAAERYLKIGGRLITITFHSLEDTIVKRHVMGNITDDVANEVPLKYISAMLCHEESRVSVMFETNWRQLHKHVITPKFEEIEDNPRSRSAKFRAMVKIKNSES
jgi:16S rRNA (cytosine(1402)-N(4))-methyltransferase